MNNVPIPTLPIDDRRFAELGPRRSQRILKRKLAPSPKVSQQKQQKTKKSPPPQPRKIFTPSSKFKSYQVKLKKFYDSQLPPIPPTQCTPISSGFKRRRTPTSPNDDIDPVSQKRTRLSSNSNVEIDPNTSSPVCA